MVIITQELSYQAHISFTIHLQCILSKKYCQKLCLHNIVSLCYRMLTGICYALFHQLIKSQVFIVNVGKASCQVLQKAQGSDRLSPWVNFPSIWMYQQIFNKWLLKELPLLSSCYQNHFQMFYWNLRYSVKSYLMCSPWGDNCSLILVITSLWNLCLSVGGRYI